MRRGTILLLILLAGGLVRLAAHAAPPAEAGPVTTDGLRLGPVPEILYTHLPDLPRGQGVVVESIQADAPLAQAGLRRFDILLHCDGIALRDGKHFAAMLSARPGQAHRLVLFRAGRQMTLALGQQPDPAPVPKSVLKPGGPPAVAVEYHPLEKGKFKVSFVYYSPAGKLEHVTRSGSLNQIESSVRQLGEERRMPARVQDLVDVALKRIRALHPSDGQ